MKTITSIVALTLLLIGYSHDNLSVNQKESYGENNSPEFYCPPAPSFAETIKVSEVSESNTSEDIDQGWYEKVIQNIQEEEYNITYSDELGTYQSPNRANNIRFIYHKDGFTAKTRTNKIPKFDVNDKTLKEEEKEYETIEEFEIDFRISNDELRVTDKTIQVAGNKAWIENESIRIDYTNNKEGMRQDFIIKHKPTGAGKLRVDINAETELKMIVGADALMFKNENGEEKMKYTALKVWDANGRELRAFFEETNLQVTNYELRNKSQYGDFTNDKNLSNSILETRKSFSIVVNDEDAVYPIIIDPISTSSNWSAEGEEQDSYFAHSFATAGDVNGDGYSDVIVGAYQFGNAQGKAYVYHGSSTGLSLTANWSKIGDVNSGFFGYCVATAGDVNGDGYSDVIIGQNGYTISRGRALVYHGSATGLSATANWSFASSQSGDGLGSSVSTAGDVNGDGYSDVVVGSPDHMLVGQTRGKVNVFHGSASGLSTNPARTWVNNVTEGSFGNSVSAAGDVNGDGYGDVIIGDPIFGNQGEIKVFHGSASGLPETANFSATIAQTGSDFGECVSTAGDVNGDGYSDVIVAIPYYTNGPESNEGGVYIYRGSSTGLVSTPYWTAESNASDNFFGTFVSTAGDVNGDGFADIIIGARGFYSDNQYEGKVFAYFGSASGLGPNGTPANADWSVEENQNLSQFGWCVALAGDVNGDGFSDVMAGSPLFDINSVEKGKVFLYNGSTAGLSATSNWTTESNQASANYGISVASAGDVNGDSYNDVVIGASLYDNGQTDEGRIYVYHGSDAGLSTSANTTSESNFAGAQLGHSVSTAGDVNGDGYSDVIAGGYAWGGQEGRVYVFHGSSAGISSVWNYRLNGDTGNEFFGWSVSTAGDVNGDGFSDVIVGAKIFSGFEAGEGRAYIFNGSLAGLNSIYSWKAESNQAGAGFGHSVSTAGDVNGDGYSDVIVGANEFDNGQINEGLVTIYYGSVSGISGVPTNLELNQDYAKFGSSVSTAGDVNGDGYSDVIIGAADYSNSQSLEGAAY